MNNLHSIHNAPPASGPCAFVRMAAVSLVGGACLQPQAQHLLASKRPVQDRQEEDQMHPGEGAV